MHPIANSNIWQKRIVNALATSRFVISAICLFTLAGIFLPVFLTGQNLPVSLKITNLDGRPLTYAHIILINKHMGTISDTSGYANVYLSIGDTLIITHLGYMKRLFYFNKSHIDQHPLQIRLIPDMIEISGITVGVLPGTYKAFKEAVANLKLPEEQKPTDLKLPWAGQFRPPPESGGLGITVMGPVQALYNLFSKEAKSLRKLAKLEKEDLFKKNIQVKYNEELISHLTGITDKETIGKFMEFCDLSNSFILSACDYDLYLAILDCHRVFLQNH
ncbi:MAG: hypothetical protein Q7J34_00410 [Bacteroidales bacterium]|jgi:hypothetical protein|nr:hypothetical protein [Bacteroidales bacterium]